MITTSVPSANGTTTVFFGPQLGNNNPKQGEYGDAPYVGMDYGTPARQQLARCTSYSDVRDFLVVSIDGGPEQVVAEVNWSINMIAYFLPPDGENESQFNPYSPQFNPYPVLYGTRYGAAPGVASGDSSKPISDRSKVANEYIVQEQNWHSAGKPGSIGVTYPIP